MASQSSIAERLASLPARIREKVIARLTDSEIAALSYDWSFWARPNQLAPTDDDWLGWLVMTGRGWGKNRCAGEYSIGQIRDGLVGRAGFIARTSGDVRDVMVEGESGILAISPPDFRPTWEPSRRRITWPNGAIATTYSAEEPDVLRGPQHDMLWADEIASWKFQETTWSNAMLGLRLGERPRWVATTTPKSRPLITRLLKQVEEDDSVVRLTTGSTYDNVANLAPTFISQVIKPMEGTRLAIQEIEGKTITDDPNALWKRETLDRYRVTKAPDLVKILVAVDPSMGSADSEGSETGIIVGGVGTDGHGYVVADCSLRGSPSEWARAAVKAWEDWKANGMVAEANQGGDMVIATITTENRLVPVKKIHASRGKYTRAEPVAALYERGMIHHVGYYAELEDQLCTWVPGEKSPDRLDALVWAFSELLANIDAPVYGRNYGILRADRA